MSQTRRQFVRSVLIGGVSIPAAWGLLARPTEAEQQVELKTDGLTPCDGVTLTITEGGQSHTYAIAGYSIEPNADKTAGWMRPEVRVRLAEKRVFTVVGGVRPRDLGRSLGFRLVFAYQEWCRHARTGLSFNGVVTGITASPEWVDLSITCDGMMTMEYLGG